MRRMKRNILDTNTRGEKVLECRYERCEKVCKSRGGSTAHERRMQEAAQDKIMFEFGKCGRKLETDRTMINHEKSYGGVGGMRECGECVAWVTVRNYNEHRRTCVSVGALVVGGK